MNKGILKTISLALLSTALANCNGSDKHSDASPATYTDQNGRLAQLESDSQKAQATIQQAQATIQQQGQQIVQITQMQKDADATSTVKADEIRASLAALQKNVAESPEFDPAKQQAIQDALAALTAQLQANPKFDPETLKAVQAKLDDLAKKFEASPTFDPAKQLAIQTALDDLKSKFDASPKFDPVAQKAIQDSIAALQAKFDATPKFDPAKLQAIQTALDDLKAKFDASAKFDPATLTALKDTLSALKAQFDASPKFDPAAIKAITDRLDALVKLVDGKIDKPIAAIVSQKVACTTEELSDIVTSTPATLLDKNQAPGVVPRISKWQGGSGDFNVTSSSRVVLEPLNAAALKPVSDKLVADIAEITGLTLSVVSDQPVAAGDIALSLSPCNATVTTQIGSEGYTMNVQKAAILRGNLATGMGNNTNSIFYATRTLLQMLSLDGKPAKAHQSVKQGYMIDYSRYAQRSVMLDVGRLFADKEFLKSYMKFMSWYKLNTLHLHINDFAKTTTGAVASAFRLKTDNSDFAALIPADGKYYTKQDWSELEDVAAANGIQIVPEFDTPGHSTAFAVARPDLATSDGNGVKMINASNTATLPYIQSVFTEFLPWFKSNRVHIGGDEVVGGTPAVVVPFLNSLGSFLISKGKTVEIWGDMTYLPTLDTRFIIQRWINWGTEWPINWKSKGYTWIESYADWYIVPFGPSYFNPSGIKGDDLYAKWNNNRTQPEDPATLPVGGQISVWNDNGFSKIYTWEKEVHALLKDAIPAAGQVFWQGQSKDSAGVIIPYPTLRSSIATLQYGPGVTTLAASPISGN
jgi:hexosaminidase